MSDGISFRAMMVEAIQAARGDPCPTTRLRVEVESQSGTKPHEAQRIRSGDSVVLDRPRERLNRPLLSERESHRAIAQYSRANSTQGDRIAKAARPDRNH